MYYECLGSLVAALLYSKAQTYTPSAAELPVLISNVKGHSFRKNGCSFNVTRGNLWRPGTASLSHDSRDIPHEGLFPSVIFLFLQLDA